MNTALENTQRRKSSINPCKPKIYDANRSYRVANLPPINENRRFATLIGFPASQIFC